MNTYNHEEDELATERFITSTAKVIEYLEPLMSRDLLYKFPDNTAFDFDYSQSSIWSPLVPRAYSSIDLDLVTPRKLSYDQFGYGYHQLDKKKTKHTANKVGSSIKKKININSNILKKNKKKMVMNVVASDFSPASVKGSCVPIATKGWTKVLKAASKHFKKKKKKKDPSVHVKLSNRLTDSST